MVRYLKLVKTLFRQSMQRELAFRANFGVNVIHSTLHLVGGVGGVVVLFAHSDTLNGWDFSQTLALLGVYLLVQSLKNLFIGPSLAALAGLDGHLWTGEFDFTLLKPVPTQVLVSLQAWSPWALVDTLLSIVVIGLAMRTAGVPHCGDLLLFLLSLFAALGLLYAILLFLAAVAFWYLGTPMMWIFDSILQMGRFPIRIYPHSMSLILTWVIPVGFIVTIPAEFLSGQGTAMLLLPGFALSGLLVGLASHFFRVSVRRYSSASS